MKLLAILVLLVLLPAAAVQAHRNSDAQMEEKNKVLIRRFYEEVWNKGNMVVAEEIIAANYVRHDPRGGAPAPGPEGQKQIAAGFRRAVSNTALNIDFMVAEGDFVVARWTIRGDHKLSGKKLEFVGVNIFRLKDGKVVEIWNHRDDLGFTQQTTAK